MLRHRKLLAASILAGVLGVSANGFAAAVQLILDLQNGTVTIPDAIDLWDGSVAEYVICEAAAVDAEGADRCMKILMDPDQVLGGELRLEFDLGVQLSSGDLQEFPNSHDEALLPLEIYANRLVGGQPEIFTAPGSGSTRIQRNIAFDANFLQEGAQDIVAYELAVGATQTLAGFSPSSASATPVSLDIFDEETGLVVTFTPERVSTDFNVRLLNVVGETVDSHLEALAIVDGSQPESFSFDVTRNYATVNFGGGTFGNDEAFQDGGPNDNSREDYILTANAEVDIPTGQWAIAFGSDDGGQLTLGQGELVDFEFTFNEDDPVGNPGQLFFNGNRAHAWTGGAFVADQPLRNVEFFASMHERGGDDTFEIAICDFERSQCSEEVSAENGWVLLRDGALGWGVGTELKVQPDGALDSLFESFEMPIVSGSVTPNGKIVVNATSGVELAGLEFNSASQSLVPVPPGGRTAPATPFAFLLSNNPEKVTFAAAPGTSVTLDGKLVLSVAYTGSNPETDITAFWGMGPTPVRFTVFSSLGGSANDCNGDGVVNAGDLSCACASGGIDNLLAELGLIKGDLNGNGTVEFGDFLILSANFGKNINGYNLGDIDCNGSINFADFLVLSANFGESAAGPLSVPEPSGCALITMCVLFVRRRQSRSLQCPSRTTGTCPDAGRCWLSMK